MLKGLHQGDEVIVAGEFLHDAHEELRTTNLTSAGNADSPNFLVRFRDVRPA